MTMQWGDERLDAALREFLDVRADEIGAAARPVRVVSTDLADQLGDTGTGRRSWRRARRNNVMNNTLKVALTGATALFVGLVLGLYLSQPGELIGPPAPTPSPDPVTTVAPTLLPTPEPTPEAANPIEIAQAYIEARNAYDSDRARELVADNFFTTEPDEGFRDLASLELAFEKHKAFGFHYSDGDCRERSASPDDAVVECNYLWTTELHRISGHAPTPAHFAFRIRDARVASVLHSASYAHYFGPGSFSQFLSGHREYRDRLDDTHELEPEEAREVLELLPEYFQLYEEWLNSLEQTPAPSPLGGIGAFESGLHAMSTARLGHTATLLSDGRVLIAGGTDDWAVPFLSSAETYDHSTGQLTETGSMTGPRLWHTATLLADGRVLMAGGWVEAYAGTASTEIYDPARGTFSPADSMGSARRDHTSTLLPDGRVLIAGGRDGPGEFWQTAEVYDPESGGFEPTGLMTVARLGHTATLMADGRVLIAGGRAEASAEIYDPASGTFSSTGSMGGLRGDHTATLLGDRRVLIVGGCYLDNGFTCVDWPGFNAHAATEIYDPATGVFVAANPLTVGRQAHTATLLSDGRVLVTGGVASYWDNGRMSRRMSEAERLSAEIWDPDSGSFSAAASMGAMRTNHTATSLPDGRVLIVGGQPTHELALDSVELYYP